MDHPPTYETSTTQFSIKVNLRQTASLADTPDTLPYSPLWARLLGVAVSREWLHSSGILNTYQVPITSETTFEDFDNKIREKFHGGAHGQPLKWLSWVYVLRGRWLGRGSEIETIVLDQANWENGKVAMQALLDVRLELVFSFLYEEKEKEKEPMLVSPPPYSRLCRKQKSVVKSDGLTGEDGDTDTKGSVEESKGVVGRGEKATWRRRACLLCPLKGLLEGYSLPWHRSGFQASTEPTKP